MRRDIVMLGFFIIVLILIAGCTSTQNGTATGSKSQNPASRDTNVKMTYIEYMTPIFECNLPPIDPIRFQKFLPNLSGYERQYGQNISGNNYVVNTKMTDGNINTIYSNRIIEKYSTSDKSLISSYVAFEDYGPCAESLDARLNLNEYGTFKTKTHSKITFHGYPAQHMVDTNGTPGYINQDYVTIWINNRLSVHISIESYSEGYPLSEAEADIEKFANAIDFKGFAASV